MHLGRSQRVELPCGVFNHSLPSDLFELGVVCLNVLYAVGEACYRSVFEEDQTSECLYSQALVNGVAACFEALSSDFCKSLIQHKLTLLCHSRRKGLDDEIGRLACHRFAALDVRGQVSEVGQIAGLVEVPHAGVMAQIFDLALLGLNFFLHVPDVVVAK